MRRWRRLSEETAPGLLGGIDSPKEDPLVCKECKCNCRRLHQSGVGAGMGVVPVVSQAVQCHLPAAPSLRRWRSSDSRATAYRWRLNSAPESLSELAGSEDPHGTMQERFFHALKRATIDGYYTSRIGIHQDLQYQGNEAMRDFPGCQHTEAS